MWTDPIFDRTVDDITDRTSKAFLNVADWERINDNTTVLRGLLVTQGYEVDYTPLTPPEMTSIPTAEDINALVENIEACRLAMEIAPGGGIVALFHAYQPGAGAVAPDWRAVNAWEQNLSLLKQIAELSADYRIIRAGVAEAGQTRTWQHRWRD
jgi:hypothetical protein